MTAMLSASAAPKLASAPPEDDVFQLPDPIVAKTFEAPTWDAHKEPLAVTLLRSGESFLDGVKRVWERSTDATTTQPEFCPFSKGCNTFLPGMRVAEDQVGITLKNGRVVLRPPGAYYSSFLNPWKNDFAVIPIRRDAGLEFDPLMVAGQKNRQLANLDLGQSYRQIVLQGHQIAVLEDQTNTYLVTKGTYVYSNDVEMRGVIDLTKLTPIIVERETEDTVAATSLDGVSIDQHGRPNNKTGHGVTVKATTRRIPAGYTATVAGITLARPEKGFVVLHKSIANQLAMTESMCIASGTEAFVQGHNSEGILEVEFGDTNHHAKSTPILQLKSKDNLDAICRAQIKWKQFRPDIWIAQRGAFTDPFDMLEERIANMMKDWLLSVHYTEALEEKASGFAKVEHLWSTALNQTGREYGVSVLAIEITALRFPTADSQDEKVALQVRMRYRSG